MKENVSLVNIPTKVESNNNSVGKYSSSDSPPPFSNKKRNKKQSNVEKLLTNDNSSSISISSINSSPNISSLSKIQKYLMNGLNINNNDYKQLIKSTSDSSMITSDMQSIFDNCSSIYIQCKCGTDFCFTCGEEYHMPATCKQVECWQSKCMKESENAKWIVTNTKKCPKCFTRIERNHGCNHMICFNCKYEFCWVCSGSWTEHGLGTGGYYRCNKYKAKSQMGNRVKLKEKEEEELDKFVHYFNRYHNHHQSKQFLIESSKKVIQKIKMRLQSGGNVKNIHWIDVQFLQTAHEEIFFCRQILKYTYVYAYYMCDESKEKDLFEFLQQDLERNCEMLHELCEQNWQEINQKMMINYTNISHHFVKQLLDGISKGLTNL